MADTLGLVAAPEPGRDPSGRFLPGASGNPAGRPPVLRTLADLAVSTSPAAMLSVLAGLAADLSFPAGARVAAARAVLAYHAVRGGGGAGDLAGLSDAELAELAAAEEAAARVLGAELSA